MSTPRALKPFLGAGSRFLVDQLAPRSGGSPSSRARFLSRPPTSSICLTCQYSSVFNRRQLRFSSNSSSSDSKPPDGSSTSSSSTGTANNTNTNTNTSVKDREGKDHHSASQNGSPDSSPSPSSMPSSPPPPFNPFAMPPPQDFPSLKPEQPSPQSPPTPKEKEQKPEQSKSQGQEQPKSQPQPRIPLTIDLPSALNFRRSAINKTLSSFMDRAQTTLFTASKRLNDLTGYSGIETLKSQISSLEASLSKAQEHLHASRNKYKSSVAHRSTTQREITTLLARQKTWTPGDFQRFTDLYRSDYELDAGVAQAARELEEAEREAEQLGRELNAGILARYHEEQIWSDKIRRMSTWGTWGLMGVNILLFLVLQFGAEPWRRQRLVRGFEDKVREALADEWAKEREAKAKERESDREWAEAMNIRINAATATVPAAVNVVGGEQEDMDTAAPEPVPAPEPVYEKPPIEPPISLLANVTWREVLTDAGWWKDTYYELSSDRRVAVRMRDISIIALEGAAIGVTIAGAVAAIVIRWA
ncbi:hypothetical protein F4810DRAFT_70892 [Camillea tinctor]|nr:hypothetical protein F4810DRAFT_70892 [Camillea tinctor]